jgi:hypothetical protein
VGAETARERERANGGDEREQKVGGVKRNLRNAVAQRKQQREKPRVERRMRLAAHIDIAAHEDVLGVLRMQRLDLRVGGFGQIKDIVPLQSLVEERQAQGEDDQRNENKLAAQVQLPMLSTTRKRALPLNM